MKNLKGLKIYTKDHCPFCVYLKNYLTKNDYEFENISVDDDQKLYENLKAKTNHNTVPQVFIGDKFIGGSEEILQYLKHLEENHPELIGA